MRDFFAFVQGELGRLLARWQRREPARTPRCPKFAVKVTVLDDYQGVALAGG